jgi:hypothetical protein
MTRAVKSVEPGAAEVMNGVTPGELKVVSLDRAAVRAGARVRIEAEVRR